MRVPGAGDMESLSEANKNVAPLQLHGREERRKNTKGGKRNKRQDMENKS